MDSKTLARNLAVTLTAGGWQEDVLVAALGRRLPGPVQRWAGPVAVDLLAALPGPFAPARARVAMALVDTSGFRRIFNYCKRRDIWPAPDLTPAVMAPAPAFADIELPQLPTPEALAAWLMLDLELLDHLADPRSRHERHGDMAVNNYHTRAVPKRRGGMRLIEAPKQRLKSVQRQVALGLLGHVPVHDAAFGFVPGRSCLAAARLHAGERMVVSFDLADFFASIGWGRVFGLYRRLGYPAQVARLLTGLCTTQTPPRALERMPIAARQMLRESHLPQGAPTSPVLANVLSFGLDARLAGLARQLGARYTRYADDLTFSGDAGIAGPLQRAVPLIVQDAGFGVNPDKTRVMPARSRQSVTGVVVNAAPNVNRGYFDRLKAVIHACGDPADPRLRDPAFCAQLAGQIGWVRQVNPQRGAKLDNLLVRALARRQGGPAP